MKIKRLMGTAVGLCALLLSFNTNAALSNTTDSVWEFDITSLHNVNSYLGFAEWEGTELDIVALRQMGTSSNYSSVGFFDWEVNGLHVATQGAFGVFNEATRSLALLTSVFGADVWITGIFSSDFLSATGEIVGFGRSDLYGTWEMSQVTPIDLPSAGWLFFSALGGFLLVPRKRDITDDS